MGLGIFDAPPAQAPLVPLIIVTAYVAPIPLASALASQGGIVARILVPLFNFSSEHDGNFAAARIIAAVSLFYLFMAYVFTAGLSLAGQTAGNTSGYRNKEPRSSKHLLTGLPHRLTAVHQNLMEIFPAFAVCAAVALAVPNSDLQAKCINFLTLHVVMKTCFYIPAYLLDIEDLRSVSHFLGIASLLGLLVGVVRS